MRVALVHDWLTGMRGGEWCLMAFLAIYPDADVYSLIHVPGTTNPVIDKAVRGTSFLQKLPGVRRYYRLLLPVYPYAARSIRLDGYDLVISLSHAAAKNVSVPASTHHVCYCFTPMRYIWDQAEQYFGRYAGLLTPLGRQLQEWDVKGADGVDDFVAISKFVAARIRKIYGRSATVIHPPVETDWIAKGNSDACLAHLGDDRESGFLCAGALVPYKRVDVAIDAFRDSKLKLWIVGDGPAKTELQRRASSNVRFFGRQSDEVLGSFMRHCRALIFPGVEDFGMIPVETMAAGRPVIGIDRGGLRETVRGMRPWANSGVAAEDATGVFLTPRQYGNASALLSAVQFFCHREQQFNPENAQQCAQRFSPTTFFDAWAAFARSRGIPEHSGILDGQPRSMRSVVNDRF